MFGILNFQKLRGPTSRDCVNQIQRLVRPIKVGHGGTLDPIASGVLLLLIGPASRLTEEVHEFDKEYVGTFRLGVTSPSADTETEVTELVEPSIPSFAQLTEAATRFVGTIQQTPPIYSALSIGGRRAHELARQGVEVEMPERSVRIDQFEILAYEYPVVRLRIVCGTGTYVRSLGRDLARQLGSDAVMTDLIRTRIGPYRLEASTSPDSLASRGEVESHLQPASTAVAHWLTLRPSEEILDRLKNGQRVPCDLVSQEPFPADFEERPPGARAAIISQDGVLHSLVRHDPESETWKAFKYFPTPCDP
jgi:tRNA pseudouridine55 synthase